ncbi:Clp protease N-terminal domain-containing protein [Micromonospora sp. NPDC049679]|uniref:Clp protease N-terminal domain-containing protein n=1 Tax=Micromonospora sp. NPDC049679 TaxID=3155920 RepID=UPI0033CE25D1
MDRMTRQARDALQAARHGAARIGNTEVDGEHLLLALLEPVDSRVSRLVAELGVDPAPLRVQIEEELSLRPRVSAADFDPDALLLTRRLRRLLEAATREADELGDECVGEDHLLAALAQEGPATPGGLRLREHGITRDVCRATLARERRPAPSAVERSATTDGW